MKLREIMTDAVVRIRPDEPVAVAARTLTQYNIGALPVCGYDGRLKGMVTDRDMVTRCLAAERDPDRTTVSQVMTSRVVSARPDMELEEAARLMGTEQIRRLPVVENGKLCGIVSLKDMVAHRTAPVQAWQALEQISGNLSSRP